ncbi:glycoprotein 3, partial [Klebsiella pneumoniae]|nr:glycoprotein 3 [Klebsiella pneumoniae]
MCAPAESPHVETTRKPAMTDTTFIPDYLKPALERLAAARAAHLEQARLMEDTLTA